MKKPVRPMPSPARATPRPRAPARVVPIPDDPRADRPSCAVAVGLRQLPDGSQLPHHDVRLWRSREVQVTIEEEVTVSVAAVSATAASELAIHYASHNGDALAWVPLKNANDLLTEHAGDASVVLAKSVNEA